MNCFKPLMKYHVIFIIPQLNSSGVLEIACFNKPTHKKARFSKQQNLASEEGDEKLFVGS